LSPAEQSELHMNAIRKILNDTVVAHETAHQWWGDLVTWRGYRDQWLMEGLANYSSLMLLESEDPGKFQAILNEYRSQLLSQSKEGVELGKAGPVTLGTRLSSSH